MPLWGGLGFRIALVSPLSRSVNLLGCCLPPLKGGLKPLLGPCGPASVSHFLFRVQGSKILLFQAAACLLDITIPLEDVRDVRSKIGLMPVALDLDMHLPIPCMFRNPVHCWLIDFADLPVSEDVHHAPMPKRRRLDQSAPHGAPDTQIALGPDHNRVLEKRRIATEHRLRNVELWQPIQGLCMKPFSPLTSFVPTSWQQTSDTRLTTRLPSQTGVEMLTAWDQTGVFQAFKDVGWRIFSCTVDGFLHCAIESLPGMSTPVGLIALTDVLFLNHLRSLEAAANITASHPQDSVLIKVKSLSGLNAWFRTPSTITFGSIHHAWSRAAAGTHAEPVVRLVVGAKQVMPHVPVTHHASSGRCTVHVVLPLQGGAGAQHCSIEGEHQLLDTWSFTTPESQVHSLL